MKLATVLLMLAIAMPVSAKRKPIDVDKDFPYHFIVVSTSYTTGIGCSMTIASEYHGATSQNMDGGSYLVQPTLQDPCMLKGTKLRGSKWLKPADAYTPKEYHDPIMIRLLWYVDDNHVQYGLYNLIANF